MKKTITVCDFCGQDCSDIPHVICAVQGYTYDMCEKCLPKGHKMHEVELESVAETHGLQPKKADQHFDFSKLPTTCYAARFLTAFAAGHKLQAEHNKAKLMHSVLKSLKRNTDGTLSLDGHVTPSPLVGIITYVNAHPEILTGKSTSEFAYVMAKNRLCAISTARVQRQLFNEGSGEEL